MVTEDIIRQRLVNSLDASEVDVVVEGSVCGGGLRLHLVVVSNLFEGKSLIMRHRMVNELFSDEIKSNEIHAITIKAYTPAQFDAKNNR
jgi:acid stress-induced BolA-like protein IbaG/YrbA